MYSPIDLVRWTESGSLGADGMQFIKYIYFFKLTNYDLLYAALKMFVISLSLESLNKTNRR